MTDPTWWPGLIVLAAGTAAGLFLAYRFRRAGGGKAAAEQSARDLALKIQDLEERRDDLYRRLRDESDALTESDRRQLELAAARTLRDLELLVKAGKKSGARKRAPMPGTAKTSSPETRRSFSSRRPLMTGFLFGGAMAAVIGILIFWAVRDTGLASSSEVESSEQEHPASPALPGGVQAELEALEAQLEREPGDAMTRRRLALLLLSNEQFVPAFQQAQALVDADPEDIDGLYVQGVVRVQMGQAEPAVELFDRVLELYPDHVQALAWKGIVQYQTGQVSAAIASWERGIEAAGGRHPELEQMVTSALEEEAGLAPAPTPLVQEPAEVDEAEATAPAGGQGFLVRIEVESGIEPPPGVLFVALRSGAGGPPVAVRRVDRPSFPLELRLTEADSMMGGALPGEGEVSVRLDQDGDISGSTPGDLSAAANATAGETTTLSLGPS